MKIDISWISDIIDGHIEGYKYEVELTRESVTPDIIKELEATLQVRIDTLTCLRKSLIDFIKESNKL